MLMRAIESYLEMRRATGYHLENDEYHLRSFARFAAKRRESHVRIKTAIAWAAKGPTPPTRERRLQAVARFARHARLEDRGHEIPPQGAFARHYRGRRLPYIFTHEELGRILAAAAQLPPPGTLRPWTYCTILGLLASTGLRVSEALALRLGDVTADGLVIRQTKFRKSRLVPLHETTAKALNEFLQRRRAIPSIDDRIFLSVRRRALAYVTTRLTFDQLVRAARIDPGPDRRRPHLHDLRHSFAVRALESSPVGGRDQVARHMVALSTYLGHTQVRYTFWYLQATPRLMAGIADACEALEHGDRL